MTTPITSLDTVPNLEKQFLLILEAFSDDQKAFAVDYPALTPIQVITSFTRDHLTGIITGSFQLESVTTQVTSNGTVTIEPTAIDFNP
jgi:hypothetical protein